jgi:hypothetical protein
MTGKGAVMEPVVNCLPRGKMSFSTIAYSRLTPEQFRARRESVCIDMKHFRDFSGITLAEIFSFEEGDLRIPLFAERLLDAYVREKGVPFDLSDFDDEEDEP